ncbi:hypothetical protein CRUP_020181 [Coryphaenoides rupestris]|nr:hypothetical protein CRUP_020181 [Coryphaenoides rupestris]
MNTALKELVQYRRLYLLSLVLGLGGSFQYGIQVSMMAPAAEHVKSFVNKTWVGRYNVPVDASTNMLIWSFVVSVFSLGAWAGAIHSGSLPVTHGRKKALLFNNVVAVVAALLMVFSHMARSFEMILLARFLYGYNAELESMQGEKAKTVMDVLRSRCVRWQLLALAIPCAGVQFCGNNALYFYAFDIFREAGVAEDKMHYLSIGIGATEFVTISLCSLVIDRAGRKKLMGYGYLLMGATMSILIVTLSFKAWRPSAYVCSGTINWVSLFLIGMLFPYIVDGIGQFCFLIFVAYCIFSSAFMLYFVPETKGKSMTEIAEDFKKLNFKNTHTDTEKENYVLQTQF